MKVTMQACWFPPDAKEGDAGLVTELEVTDYVDEKGSGTNELKLSILGNEVVVDKIELQAALNCLAEVENAT